MPIPEDDRPYTSFEADGKLYQFKRIPFGVKNGIPGFQCSLVSIAKNEILQGIDIYLESSKNQSNQSKTASRPICFYKIQVLIRSSFPLSQESIQVFNEIENATISSIDNEVPLTDETDASDFAFTAALSQEGRPDAFYTQSLNNSEQHYSSIKKEAFAIVETLHRWKQYLLGRHFGLITDKRSVSFMFSDHHPGKIRNKKISSYNHDIIYRSRKEDHTADVFSGV
nr:uncharacterized protein LOC106682030 [Halyomorpha halys]